jgi:hypothetical protein
MAISTPQGSNGIRQTAGVVTHDPLTGDQTLIQDGLVTVTNRAGTQAIDVLGPAAPLAAMVTIDLAGNISAPIVVDVGGEIVP